MPNKIAAYEEAEKDLEVAVVKVFDEDMTFYKDTNGQVFANKEEALYSQSKINKYKNRINALRDILKDRLVNLNREDMQSVTRDIRYIENSPSRMIVNPYNIIFKVYSDSDFKDVIDKINELGMFPMPFKKHQDCKYSADKPYDVVFINTDECRMTTLSSLLMTASSYIEAYNDIYNKID